MTETAWSRNVDWKARYSKLYSSRGLSHNIVKALLLVSNLLSHSVSHGLRKSRSSFTASLDAVFLALCRKPQFEYINNFAIRRDNTAESRYTLKLDFCNISGRRDGAAGLVVFDGNADISTQRYSVLTFLYPGPKKEEPSRISFMSNDTTPYASLLLKMRSNRRESCSYPSDFSPVQLKSLMSQRSECFGSCLNTQTKYDDLGGHGTVLLDMVRSRSSEARDEIHEQPLPLPRDENIEKSHTASESCVHGLSYRVTERSASRSRVSRASVRRDMDIASILAFTASPTPAPVTLEIPGFEKVKPQGRDIPRWSIRRSVCPVCSQKWRDKSSIKNIKYSGLKRNLSNELPSVIAPARIRTSLAMEYVPRYLPVALYKEPGPHGGLRSGGASWLLSRARRFRAPPPRPPPPEATAPPTTSAPRARKDLDTRVSLFLSDQFKLK